MTVSYLITLYNKQDYIGQVLDSALAEQAQTGGEILIYDDAATDRSPEIVRERLAAHPAQAGAVRVVRGEVNRGVAYGTNYLVEAATQPYIRFVDADDELVIGSTAHMLRLMQKHKLDFIYGKMMPQGTDLGRQAYDECFMLEDPIDMVLRHFTGYLTSSLFVAEKLKKAFPIPAWIRRAPDFPIFLRMACHGVAIGGVDEIAALLPSVYTASNLSSGSAAMYAELSRTAAADEKIIPLRNLRKVTRRYAGRTTKYYRNGGQSKLSPKEKFNLWRWRQFAWMATPQTCVARLNKIAELLDRDRDVVKGFRNG